MHTEENKPRPNQEKHAKIGLFQLHMQERPLNYKLTQMMDFLVTFVEIPGIRRIQFGAIQLIKM